MVNISFNIRTLINKAGKHKLLIQNFSYLSILQIFNIILPIITYPYLIRTIGSDLYGLIIYAQAVIGYLVLLVNFGFNISATKEISINRNNENKLGEIVSSILIIKTILFITSIFILCIFLTFISNDNGNNLIFYLSMWMCLYELLFQGYYFQGIEKMKYVTYLSLLSRLLFLCLIFLFIKTKADYLLVPILNGIGAIIAGSISIAMVIRNNIKITIQPYRTILMYVKKSYVMALAYFSNSFKSYFNVVIIKHLFSYKDVAYFDLAMKITSLGNTFIDIISQTIFPKMSREKNHNFIKQILRLSIFISIIFILTILIEGNGLVLLLGGLEMLPATKILYVLIFMVPIYAVGTLLGRNCLIVNGHEKHVLLSMLYSSFFYIFGIAVLFYSGINISLLSMVFILITSFLLEAIYRYYICKTNNII